MRNLTAEKQLVTGTNFSLFSIANLLDPEEFSKIRCFKYLKCLTVFIFLLKSKHFLIPIGNSEVGFFVVWLVWFFSL